MAKLRLRKYPKSPKKSATNAVKENFIAKCREIDKINSALRAEAKRGEQLDKTIKGLVSSVSTHPTAYSTMVHQKYTRKRKAKASLSGTKSRKSRTKKTTRRR